jgi:hypothetical protein
MARDAALLRQENERAGRMDWCGGEDFLRGGVEGGAEWVWQGQEQQQLQEQMRGSFAALRMTAVNGQLHGPRLKKGGVYSMAKTA